MKVKTLFLLNIPIVFFGIISTGSDLLRLTQLQPPVVTQWSFLSYTHYYWIDINGSKQLLGTPTIGLFQVSIVLVAVIDIIFVLKIIFSDNQDWRKLQTFED